MSAAFADEGPTLKRWRPRARGRVGSIKKRTCHITVQLTAGENGATPARRKADAPKTDDAPKPKRQRTPRARAEKTTTPRGAEQTKPQPARRTQKKGS